MILLSIIVPLYNSEKYIRKCMDSLLNQDIAHTDYEIILVDDGSPDSSAEIALSYTKLYTTVRLISHENRGTGEARNSGIRAAKGRYLVMIDPDDYVQPVVFKDLIVKMESENLDILRFNYKLVDELYNELPMPKGAKNMADYNGTIVDGNTFLSTRLGYACFVWSYIYRTQILQENQLYYKPRFYIDDTEWLPRVLLSAKRVTSIQTQVVYYVQHAGSLMNTNVKAATLRKLEGCYTALEMLTEELTKQTDNRVRKWYKGMISVIVIGSLQIIETVNENKSESIKKLRKMNLFPLSFYRHSRHLRLKIFLANLSPELYCKFTSLKK